MAGQMAGPMAGGSLFPGQPSWPGYGWAMAVLWPAWPASLLRLPENWPNGHIFGSLFKGLLPHFIPNLLPTLELIFLHCFHPFELCYLSIRPIVLASF